MSITSQLFISFDVLNIISKYLPINKSTKLKHCCKLYHGNIKITLKRFDKILIKKINNASSSNIGKELLNIIKNNKNKIVIGGSTIYQCLFNVSIPTSDIDIYIEHANLIETICYISDNYRINYMSQNNEVSKNIFELFKRSPLKQTEDDIVDNYMIEGYHLNYYNSAIKKNKKENIAVQLIFVKNLSDHVNKFYDFTFNLNYYNGLNVASKYKNDLLNKTGKMASWEQIYNNIKHDKKLCYKTVYEHAIRRLAKYKDRGFNITNYKELLESLHFKTRKYLLKTRSFCKIIDVTQQTTKELKKYIVLHYKLYNSEVMCIEL